MPRKESGFSITGFGFGTATLEAHATRWDATACGWITAKSNCRPLTSGTIFTLSRTFLATGRSAPSFGAWANRAWCRDSGPAANLAKARSTAKSPCMITSEPQADSSWSIWNAPSSRRTSASCPSITVAGFNPSPSSTMLMATNDSSVPSINAESFPAFNLLTANQPSSRWTSATYSR